MELNIDKKTVEPAYESEDNTERIVGYSDGSIYLYDVNDYKLYQYDLDSEDKTFVGDVDAQDEMEFEWCGNVLFIYDFNGNAIQTIER